LLKSLYLKKISQKINRYLKVLCELMTSKRGLRVKKSDVQSVSLMFLLHFDIGIYLFYIIKRNKNE